MTAVLVSLLSLLPAAWAHGNMQVPPTWFDPAGQLGANNRLQCGGVFSACDWFTNFTFTPGPPTLPPALWTYTKLWDPHQPVFHPSRLRYHKEKVEFEAKYFKHFIILVLSSPVTPPSLLPRPLRS